MDLQQKNKNGSKRILVTWVKLALLVFVVLALVALPYRFDPKLGALGYSVAIADSDGDGDGDSDGDGDGGSGDPAFWSLSSTAVSGGTTPYGTFKLADGTFCRRYVQDLNLADDQQTYYGMACRDPEGRWGIPRR